MNAAPYLHFNQHLYSLLLVKLTVLRLYPEWIYNSRQFCQFDNPPLLKQENINGRFLCPSADPILLPRVCTSKVPRQLNFRLRICFRKP